MLPNLLQKKHRPNRSARRAGKRLRLLKPRLLMSLLKRLPKLRLNRLPWKHRPSPSGPAKRLRNRLPKRLLNQLPLPTRLAMTAPTLIQRRAAAGGNGPLVNRLQPLY